MPGWASILILFLALGPYSTEAAQAENTALPVPAAASAVAPEQPSAPGHPVSLAGLWSLNLATDFSFSRSDDIQAFYAPAPLNVPEQQVFPGIHASLRRHYYDAFFLGLGLSTLPKGYSLQVSGTGATESYAWDALYPHVQAGWVWYRGLNSYLYFQAEAGFAILSQSVYAHSNGAKGSFEGNAYATAASLGGVWLIIPSVGLELQGGYRRALISPVEFRDTGGRVRSVYVDDSGPSARAGLAFFWGLKNPWGEFSVPPESPGPPPNSEDQSK